LYLNAEPTSDWTIPDAASFEELTAGSSDAFLHDPLSETSLMGFLSDFRSAHLEPVHSAEVVEARGTPHIPSAHQPAGAYLVAPAEEPTYFDDPYRGSPEKVADDWWLASDGRWYGPELHPDVQNEVTCQAEDPTTFNELDYPGGDVQPDVAGPKGRRPKRRGLLRSPAIV
jgi:hypothetical protein